MLFTDPSEPRLQVMEGDITKLEVHAIVTAANNSLLGGGGVDGAIHRAAGPQLLEECRQLNGCATGDAKITNGYALAASHVIHTVGPIWHGGSENESELLASCYRESFALADEYGLESIAVPAISTGVYGFPANEAARIAVREVRAFLAGHQRMNRVILVAFGESAFNVLKTAAAE